jgi:hypothetical protein
MSPVRLVDIPWMSPAKAVAETASVKNDAQRIDWKRFIFIFSW